MKVRVTITDENGKHRVGVLDTKTDTVTVAGGKVIKKGDYTNLTKASNP